MRFERILSRSRIQAAGVALAVFILAAGAEGENGPGSPAGEITRMLNHARDGFVAWYGRTPAWDRVWTGGLAASALLGVIVVLERMIQLRTGRVMPPAFRGKFLDRLREEKLDAGKSLDYCELNPSPAARVALAAVRRWGRPIPDLERAVGLALRSETDQLKRNTATLRRVAALAPLIGLLGSLTTAARALASLTPQARGATWNLAIAHALTPCIAGVALGTLALVFYDGLMGKIEKLTTSLDRLGAETVDAIAMLSPQPNVPGASQTTVDPVVDPAPRSPYHRPHFPESRERRRDYGERTIRRPRPDDDDLI